MADLGAAERLVLDAYASESLPSQGQILHLALMVVEPAIVVKSCLATEWPHPLQTSPAIPELGILIVSPPFSTSCQHAVGLPA